MYIIKYKCKWDNIGENWSVPIFNKVFCLDHLFSMAMQTVSIDTCKHANAIFA